jgi:cytochrome c
MLRRARLLPLLLALCAVATPLARAQLRGHGGPVRTVAVSPDGSHAVSGSFDATAIVWSLATASAERVLRFHDSAVNAAVFLPDGRMVTAGEDGSIAVWPPISLHGGAARPERVLKGHTAPIVGLAVSPDGKTLASASWDRTVRLWSLADGAARVLEGHQQNVNGVAFTPDGTAAVSVGYDLSLRIWPLSGAAPTVVTLPAPLNAVAVAPGGEIVAAGASGKVFFLSPKGELLAEVEATGVPLIAVAVAGDGTLAAASSVRGAVAIIDMGTHSVQRLLVGPGLPAWSAAFLPDNHTLLTGGSDNLVRRWDAATGQRIGETIAGTPDDPLAAYGNDPGARVFRACVACHTLKASDPPRAGPTLAGIFGRRIATAQGYDFSPALKQLDIVWTPDTVSKLFEIGPMTYTPGTKMPEQKVGAEDRAALVKFLERATGSDPAGLTPRQ